MAVEIALAQTALNDTATVDFTSSVLSGAPKAVFCLLGDGQANGTENGDIQMSLGGTDGTRQNFASSRALDGGSTTEVDRQQDTDAAALRVATEISAGDQLDHNSFLSDGWRANHTLRGNFGKLALAVMFGGSDVTAEVGVVTLSGTSQITKSLNNTGLTPNAILFWSTGQAADGTTATFFLPTFGIAVDNGTAIKGRSIAWHEDDAISTADPKAYISTSKVASQISTGTESFVWQLDIDSMAEGQFSVTPTADPGGDEVGFLALQIDNANVDLVDVDTPTSTGVNSQTGAGFTPSFVLQALSMLTAVDSFDSTANGGAFALSLFNATEEFCYSWANEDAAGTMNTQSLTHNRAVFYDADDGTLAFDGTFDSFTGNGWDINYSSVDGTTRKGFALAIGDTGGTAVSVDIGAGSLSLAPQSFTASAGQSIDMGVGSMTFTGQALEFSASDIFRATRTLLGVGN